MTIDEEKQQLRATIRRLSAQLPFRYREAADRAYGVENNDEKTS